MPTVSPKTTPYYGGGQVVNPANVIPTSGAPSSAALENSLGTLAVDNGNGRIYGLASKSGGTAAWVLLGSSSGAIDTVNGTANQITSTPAGNTTTLSLPSAIVAPGSLTTTTTLAATTTVTGGTGVIATTGNIVASAGAVSAATTVTATLGAITATNGNLVLSTAGNKIVIATGANASVGTSAAMTAGAITVATTASSATAKIFFSKATTGGTPGDVSITAQDATGFTLTSTSNTETSTFNWWIINA